MGVNDASLSFGQGLLPESDPRITAKSGLIERYLSLGVPTIHFLNIKQLCAETGIPFRWSWRIGRSACGSSLPP